MALPFDLKRDLFAALILTSTCLLPSAKADIRAVNQCPYALTVFYENGVTNTGLNQLNLGPGQTAQLGLPTQWESGLLWASPNGNNDRFQCTQLEFSISPSNDPTNDYYDISLVNAYNLPAMINPTSLANGGVRNGLECGTPQCTISNLNGVCQLDNKFAGPDNACINTDGPGLVDTPSIDLFRNACSGVYVQSNDNTGDVFACTTGSSYDAIWCP